MDGVNLVLKALFSWTLRLALLVMGLVVFLSFLVLVLALGLIWACRALWAKLLGRPVRPWVMKVAPRDAWGRFNVRSMRGERPGGMSPDGEATGATPGAPGSVVPPSRRATVEVEDVQIKAPK